jgi:centrosomal protein CEP350
MWDPVSHPSFPCKRIMMFLSILLDSTSIATEYSLKFDESMTEDEIEEKSFRSLLPSESHRRFNMEKKRGHHDDSDEDASPDKTALSSTKVRFY